MFNRLINLPKTNSFFLFGPRQTGKTTLLKQLFSEKETLYYDLLKTDEFLRLTSQPSLFREEVKSRSSNITHVIIDEVQRIPSLLNEVHYLMESPSPPIFVLTGSSARKLKRSHANMLGGRALTYSLHPLTFQEIGNDFSLLKTLRFGSLPSVVLEETEEMKMDKLRSYVDTYLKEEIEIEAQIRALDCFIRFLSIAAISNGQLINYSKIGSETGTSYQTVKSYFKILEDTLVGFCLYPYLKSKRKRMARQPKFYFFDLGITRALTRRLTLPIEPHTPDYGRAFEHFVILEIMRKAKYAKHDFEFSFYHTEAGAEVDLIIETPKNEVLALEIKGRDIIESRHLRGLKSFSQVVPLARLCCVATVPKKRIVENITILPWQEIFEWIEGK